jgi:hypothetical protein
VSNVTLHPRVRKQSEVRARQAGRIPAEYLGFLTAKSQQACGEGIEPGNVPEFLFGFQRSLVEWSLRRGRAAIFADCGLGKTPMAIAWADEIARATDKPVLILTPLAVAHQFVREGEKFGIEVTHAREGGLGRVTVTNYERLHYFDASRFGGVVCDESSILKNFGGKTRKQITEFLRTRPYRLLCTATAAPNDYIEFGTSAEAIGEMGYMDMLTRFFKHDGQRGSGMYASGKCMAVPWTRRAGFLALALLVGAGGPAGQADLGFSDDGFALPPHYEIAQHIVSGANALRLECFSICLRTRWRNNVMSGRRTVQRALREGRRDCERNTPGAVVAWCNLNDEGRSARRS